MAFSPNGGPSEYPKLGYLRESGNLLPSMEHGKKRSATHKPEYRQMLKRLRQARKDAGMTQVEVAEAMGRPQSYLTKCELGERRIDPIELHEFAQIYGKPISYFLPRKPSQ